MIGFTDPAMSDTPKALTRRGVKATRRDPMLARLDVSSPVGFVGRFEEASEAA